jgi:enoyl-CoA hydratase
MTASDLVIVDRQYEPILIVTINRANVKNAVDGPTARQLHSAFVTFAKDDKFSVAILRGAGSTFCAGADLTAAFENLTDVQEGATAHSQSRANMLSSDMDMPGPMG